MFLLVYPLDQKSRAPKRRKPTGMVKEEDISEEEPVTQEIMNTKRQLAKRRKSKSGVTEDEVRDNPNQPQCAHAQYHYTGMNICTR